MKPRDEQKISQVYKATLGLVKENGLAGVTMGAIAKAAGIATGTLYIYFKSKDELINALFSHCRQSSAAIYFKGYDAEKPFDIGFKTIWLNLLQYRIEHFEEAIFIEQCYHSPFLTESNIEVSKKLLHPLYALMEQGKRQQFIKDLDTFLLLTFMVGSLNEVVKHAHYNNKKLTKQTIGQLYQLCWDALKV